MTPAAYQEPTNIFGIRTRNLHYVNEGACNHSACEREIAYIVKTLRTRTT